MALLAERMHAVKCLAAREFKSGLFSPGLYVPISVGFVVASIVVRNYMKSIESNGMLMLANPLNQPLYWCIVVAAIYLALSSVMSIAKEKEQGTMEILFHGPVDMSSFVVGKFIEHLGVYVVFTLIFAAFFAITSMLTNFGMGLSFIGMILASIVLASTTISFGTVISALTPRVRNATFIFLGLVALFLLLQVLSSLLGSIQPDDFSSLAAYARAFVDGVKAVLNWLSPFSYLTRGLIAIQIGNMTTLLYCMLEAIAYIVITLWLATAILRKKGVKRS